MLEKRARKRGGFVKYILVRSFPIKIIRFSLISSRGFSKEKMGFRIIYAEFLA